jgi:hypothetical protein
MSALGQKQTLEHLGSMSALPPKADIGTQPRDVRFVPIADMQKGFNREEMRWLLKKSRVAALAFL